MANAQALLANSSTTIGPLENIFTIIQDNAGILVAIGVIAMALFAVVLFARKKTKEAAIMLGIAVVAGLVGTFLVGTFATGVKEKTYDGVGDKIGTSLFK